MAVKETKNKIKRKGMLHKNAWWDNSVCSILLSYKENVVKMIIIGGVAGGTGAAARLHWNDEEQFRSVLCSSEVGCFSLSSRTGFSRSCAAAIWRIFND
ncbi:hypothetical protein [Clostridium sp. Marseille-Q7071]